MEFVVRTEIGSRRFCFLLNVLFCCY